MTARRRRVLRSLLDRLSEPGHAQSTIFSADEVARWPTGSVNDLIRVQLFKELPLADAITCKGCEERCRREVTITKSVTGGVEDAIWHCHLREDLGPFRQRTEALKRWQSSRRAFAHFVAIQLRAEPKNWDEGWRRTRYETLRSGTVLRALSLEFSDTASLKVGNMSIPLIDLIDWSSAGVSLDRALLFSHVEASEDVLSGSKRVQPSTTIRDENKTLTSIRDARLQRRFDELAGTHPTLKKDQLSKKIAKSREFGDLSASRISRIVRKEKN